MSNIPRSSRHVKVAILVVNGVLIPLLGTSLIASTALADWNHASKWKVNGHWINFVDNKERLRFADITVYDDNYSYGKTKWNAANKVKLNWNQANYKLTIRDSSDCNWDSLAETNTQGYILNNRCLMDWAGGNYPGYNGRFTQATTESRRDRTGSHELGHALGFKHWFQDGQPCASVMSSVLSDRALGGCDQPTVDDKQELKAWNY
ncbi:MAG: hypothetical protein KC442_12685 [Thermomicrobiales bacterium]|nr:hypothetical protein [Thermomicrobiales bacterium]